MALIDDKVAVFAADVDKVHRIVNGPADGTESQVVTDGGAVKTLARIGAEAGLLVQNAVDSFLQDQTLVDGPAITWDLSLGNTARVTLGPLAAGLSRVVKTPTHPKRTSGYLIVMQDGFGNRKIDAWDSGWRFAAGLAPVLSTGPNKQDVLFYICDGASFFITHTVIGAAAANGTGVVLEPTAPPPPPPPPPVPAPVTIQAEAAELYGTLRVGLPADVYGTLTDYTGSGFVMDFHDSTDRLVFRFPNMLQGQYDLGFRHARGNNTPTSNFVKVNSQPAGSFSFPATGTTGGGDKFGTFTIPNVPMQPGTNVITVLKGDGFFEIDSLTMTWNNGTLVAPPPVGSTAPPPPPPAPPPPAPVGTPVTGAGTSSVKIQAEDATLGGTLFVQTEAAANGYVWPGYEGVGWVSWFTDPTDLLTFHFTGLTAGLYDAYIRTTRENTSPQNYQVNGGAWTEGQFPGGAGWEEFKIPNITANAGAITLAIKKGDGYFHVDYARVGPATNPPQSPQSAPLPPAGGGEGYAFGSRRIAYPAAHFTPMNDTQATMDTRLMACYDAYAAHCIEQNNLIVSGGYILRFNAQQQWVSEGMGYGLMLVCAFAGHDPNARTIAEGMFRVARARPAYSITPYEPTCGPYLMNWRVGPNGEADAAHGGGDGWSACDGDLDFAFGMLMAHRQWGSTGNVNWRAEAINTINALKKWNFETDGRLYGRPHRNSLRTSDVMLQHFQAFYDATGDTFWLTAIERNLTELEEAVAAYSPTRAIIPDSLIATDLHPPQLPGNPGPTDGSATEMYMAYNALRDPWRLGCGALFVKDASVRARVASLCTRISAFLKTDTAGQPGHMATMYALDGTLPPGSIRPYLNYWYPSGNIGCALPAAMTDAAHQDWLNALWAFNRDNFQPSYYAGDLQLLSMLVATNNWWHPTDIPA